VQFSVEICIAAKIAKVVKVGTFGKLVSCACYGKQQVWIYSKSCWPTPN